MAPKQTEVKEVLLDDIRLQGINVRSDLNSVNSQEGLDELAASINEHGLLQPIVLRGPEGKKPYDVVVGQRRFLAHQRLGATTIKATFTEEIDDTEAIILSVSENLLRQELNQADVMRVVTQLYETFGRDEREVQRRLGLSIKAIRSYINVKSQATPKILSLIDEGKLTMMDAKRAIIAAQGDPAKADVFVDSLAKMTKHEKIRAVDYARSNPKATAEEIIEKGQTPKIEETIILNLPLKVSKALKTAAEQLTKDSEEIIMDVLTEWLVTNDFLLLQRP